jgi:hypothetical protein
MKKYILIILLLFSMKGGWTQNMNLDYKIAIKLYNLTTFDEYERSRTINDTSSNTVYNTTSTLQILHPTIAFQWKTKKNNFHEIELTNFILGKLTSNKENKSDTTINGQTKIGYDLVTTFISARYEYILNFNKSKDRKLVPSLGFSINPYYKQNNYSPKISSSYATSEIYFGAKVFLIPRLTYYLSSRFFIDVNIPICFLDSYYLIDKEDNPAVPLQERTISTFNFNGFPKIFGGRIGVGLKL